MKWWRSLIAVCCLVAAFAMPVSAEKVDWADKSYDFTKVQRALVYDLTFDENLELDNDLMEQVLQEDYMKNAARPPYKVIDPAKAQVLSPEDPHLAADVYITAELVKWHDDSYVKPGYTSYETRTSKRKKHHSDGSTTEETYDITVPVYHSEEIVYTSTVRLRFEVYDSRTGKRVMARDELRERDNSRHGQQGIFGRISKSFFDDLGKKMKEK
ncbi:MAG: hypothetical protein IJT01_08085 [Selenomonadaceae bacterium]|nr:hypothetical protein [Selenomonadaceae bacterium]